MIKKLSALALVVLVFAAHAQERNRFSLRTGNEFLAAQQEFERGVSGSGKADVATAALFLGFIQAVLEVNKTIESVAKMSKDPLPAMLACVPDGATIGQVSSVITKALREDPANNHVPIGITTQIALSKAFPCK